MATARCANRHPPSHPRQNGGNPNPQAHTATGVPNPGQQGPGLHATSQDQGPSAYPHPQTQVPPRPFFYVQAAPPPPLLHYQWPMPFHYNPFAGFHGMGYSMVMPPFPPNPYLEAPGYILPHPHLQPVEYRRLLHPQVPAASGPYQSQNQNRRFRPQYNVSVGRETVNSEVQTEPPLTRTTACCGDGSPLASYESGHGTNSTSPSSSSSSTGKRGCTNVENYNLPSSNAKEDFLVNRTSPVRSTAKNGYETLPTTPKTVQSHTRTPLETKKKHKGSVGQENGAPCIHGGLGHCDMWSVCSTDSMVPVCSSSDREDDVVAKERRVSFPDILMSWGGGTPPLAMLKMADKVLPQSEDQLASFEVTEAEHEKTVNQSLTERKSSQVAADVNDAKDDDAENIFSSKESEDLCKILKLPFTLQELLSESIKENEPVGLVGSIGPCVPSCESSSSRLFIHSLNESQRVPDTDPEQENGNESIPHEETTEIVPHQMSFSYVQIKRKMNESVWSVESLAPYIPSKEWLIQNGIMEPDVIIEEILEDGQNGGLSAQNDDVIVKANRERRRSRRFSMSSVDALPVYVPSASWFGDQCKVNCHNRFPMSPQQNVDVVFSTPVKKVSPQKRPEMQCQIHPSKMDGQVKQGPSMDPSVDDSLASPTHLQNKVSSATPSVENKEEKDANENGSSEPEANRSPNQESLNVIEQQQKSPCSPEQVETPLSNPVAGEKRPSIGQLCLHNKEVEMEQEAAICGHEEANWLGIEQQSAETAEQKIAAVSPSKGHFVDCGVQCSELQESNCFCKGFKGKTGVNRKSPFKFPDWKKANKAKTAEEACENGHMQKNQKRHGQWKNRLQDGQQTRINPSNKAFTHGQEEAWNGSYNKPGKTRGGNGRNQRY